jgi:hypothetical protein
LLAAYSAVVLGAEGIFGKAAVKTEVFEMVRGVTDKIEELTSAVCSTAVIEGPAHKADGIMPPRATRAKVSDLRLIKLLDIIHLF